MNTEKMSKGFTLVELMVVVAIITILVSMLFSAMRVGREKIDASHCAENQKAIGVAFFEYNADHKHIPAPMNKTEYAGGKYDIASHWWNGLGQYVGLPQMQFNKFPVGGDLEDSNVFTCAVAEKLEDSGYYDDKGSISSWKNIVGYGMSQFLWSGTYPDKKYAWNPPTETGYTSLTYRPRPVTFKYPTELQMIADARYWVLGGADQVGKSDPKEMYKFDRIRHGEGANVLFADGRVIWKSEEYWSGKMLELQDKNSFWRDVSEYGGVFRNFE